MDVKPYIDYFEEIAHLERDKQFDLLEQACEQINASSSLPVFPLITHLVRLVFLLLLLGGSYLLFGLTIWILALASVVGLLAARVVSSEITDTLIRKALKSLLLE